MNDYLSPRQIVAELEKYVIGQDGAKKEVAVALRNRYRRSRLPLAEQDEITPKNIIMKGPTGVGKTEIARRLANSSALRSLRWKQRNSPKSDTSAETVNLW